MFDRVRFKTDAKEQLEGYYNKALFAIIKVYAHYCVMMILVALLIFCVKPVSSHFSLDLVSFFKAYTHIFTTVAPLIHILIYVLMGMFVQIIFHYFLKFSYNPDLVELKTFKSDFSFLVKGGFATLLFLIRIILGGLFLIIPAFVHMLTFSQILFVLADNPQIGISRSFGISRTLTRGNRWNLLCMMFSFTGKMFIAILPGLTIYVTAIIANQNNVINREGLFFAAFASFIAMFIGLFFFIPYLFTSFAHAYSYMKESAIEQGILSVDEFYNPN